MSIYLKFTNNALVCASVISLTACGGESVRTADGDCYYRGKGLLGIGATLLDGVGSWADAELEAAYQRDQIELQQLQRELDSVNAYALSNEQIAVYSQYVAKANRLTARIKSYQDKKQRELESGPEKSLSKMVDESGDCN